jgi:hypothetical protein
MPKLESGPRGQQVELPEMKIRFSITQDGSAQDAKVQFAGTNVSSIVRDMAEGEVKKWRFRPISHMPDKKSTITWASRSEAASR